MRVWRKGNPPALFVGMQVGATTMENSMEVPQKTNPTPGHISGENHNVKRHMHPHVLTTLFTIAKTWKQPKCPSTDE